MNADISSPLEFILSLTRAQAIINRKMDGQLSPHGLGYNDFIILHYLTQASGKKLRRIDLAEIIGVTASGITRMLAPMEKMGLVGREANERDARISYVVLTPTGTRVYEESLKTVGYITKSLFPDAKLKKLELLTEAFGELVKNIK